MNVLGAIKVKKVVIHRQDQHILHVGMGELLPA
jgi:hypothetical protein